MQLLVHGLPGPPRLSAACCGVDRTQLTVICWSARCGSPVCFLLFTCFKVIHVTFYHMLFFCFHMLRVLRSPSLNVIHTSSSFKCHFVEASASLLPFLSGWLRSCFPYSFFVLEVFFFFSGDDSRNCVYNVAALPLGGACQSTRSSPLHPLAPGHLSLYTRCRWPRLGLTYISPKSSLFCIYISPSPETWSIVLLSYKALAAL